MGDVGASTKLGAAAMLFVCGLGACQVLQPRSTPPPARVHDAAAPVPTDAGAPVPDAAPPRVEQQKLTRKLNVILITVDTLRFDLGFAGYARPVSPNLDALAARSIVFERTYATAPYTMKSLAALLTGRYTSEAHRDWQHYTHYYDDNVFLAERIHATGARTVAVMCHRYFAMKAGFEQGFDVFDLSAIPKGMTDVDPRPTSAGLTNVALRRITQPENAPSGERRLFAWVHYFDPHFPYVPHAGAPDFKSMEPTSTNRARDVYDQEVWFTDQHLGRLLDGIAKEPWGKDTAIIVTADHGESFGEKGHFRHGKELWETIIRVPLVVYVPGLEPRRISQKRSHIDLAPTILELMGIPSDAEPALRGKSLVPEMTGAEPEERDVFMDVPEGAMNEPRRAIVYGASPGTKLVERGKRFALHDLAADPNEATDLAGDASRLADARSRFDALVGKLSEKKAVR